MFDSVKPHRQQPIRLPHPWDSPVKNTGVGCQFLLQCKKVKSESEVAQSCLTLSDTMDCSLPGSSIHGIFQTRVLKWGAIAFPISNVRILKILTKRWPSRRTCAHLLLQELQNYSLLLNNHQQENVGSHQKKIPQIKGQRRIHSKMVGGDKITFRITLSVQFSSVSHSCPSLCNPMNRSTPGLPVHHQLPEFTQTHVHPVSDDIQPSHPLLSPSPPAPNPSQHQSLLQ